jgi:ADP-ribose pyrophosphatase
MAEGFEIKKLTDCEWSNLFEVEYSRKAVDGKWTMCSRKERPIEDAGVADAVVIVPIIQTQEGKRLVVTKEFRVPLWDYEYGFAAGLIDDGEDIKDTVARELKEETGLQLVEIKHISRPVYSSAGLTDESCHMVLIEAKGEPTNEWQEHHEDIEVLLLDAHGVKQLLESDVKIAAKAWGLLYYFAQNEKIGF